MTHEAASVRPRDAARTRQTILDAAQPLFARHGYAGTTVKLVADAAGVSPNLITRYFGGKDGLFLAATRTRIDVDATVQGELTGLGRRLAESIVQRWTNQIGPDPLLVLHRASGERPSAAESLAAYLDDHSVRPVELYLLDRGLDAAEAHARAAAIDAFVLGVSTRQRILRENLGDRDDLTDWLASSIQHLATGR